MKILQVISTPPFAWETGGCTRVAYDLSKELVKRGHDVTILTTDMYKPDMRYIINNNPEVIDGINIYRFKNISNKLAWKYYLYTDIGIISFMKKHLKKFDVVHLHDFRSFQTIAVMHYCKKYNVPYILQPHGGVLSKNTINSKVIFDKLFTFKNFNNCKYLVALNETEKIQLINYGADANKIMIVNNGINISDFLNTPPHGKFRYKYSIDNNTLILLYLGRINKIKGLDLLIDAYSQLIKEVANTELIIVGPDDGFLKNIKDKIIMLNISDNIIFTGPLYDTEKIEAYVDADIFILPSYYESFGLSAIEACACGTPAIVTTGCFIHEIINNNLGLSSATNATELKETMKNLLNNIEFRNYFRKHGFDIINSLFSFESVASKFESIYSNINNAK